MPRDDGGKLGKLDGKLDGGRLGGKLGKLDGKLDGDRLDDCDRAAR